MKADEIKTLLLCYWRFTRGCPYIATEFDYGAADVISASPGGLNIYETEVKISIGDMKRELGKRKHTLIQRGFWGDKSYFGGRIFADYFYFAVPEAIKAPALALIKKSFPYAGLLVVKEYESYLNEFKKPYPKVPIVEVRSPSRLKPPAFLPVAPAETLASLSKGMSNTLCARSYQLLLLNRKRKAGRR